MNYTLVRKIVTYFSKQPVKQAWLFGSYARSEEHGESDIDIMVQFVPEAKITLFKYVHMVNDLQKLTGKRVDLVEYGQLKHFAASQVESEKVLIYERKAEK